MRRIISLRAVMAAMAAGPAFAACPPGPVAANNQAEGCFFTGSGQAHENSNRKADQGLDTALSNN